VEAKPAEILEFRPGQGGFGSFGSFGTGESAETDPAILPEVSPDLDSGTLPHVLVDALVADLKAAFANDDPASDAAAERLAKVRTADGPAGGDLAAWRDWMGHRYAYQRRCGYSRAEALRIVWGEAECEWHKRHGAVPDPCRCAGCGERLLPGEGLRLLDGAVVHIGDPEIVECPAVYGAQWRGAASAEMIALGLVRPA
jgi:hypothetical protein